MFFRTKANVCNLLCASRQGFRVTDRLKDIAFSKAEKLFIDKACEAEECQLEQITFPEDLRSTFSIEFSADGKYFATCHSSRILYVLNAFTLAVKWRITTDHTVWCMNFHPLTDTGLLAVGTLKSKVYIYQNGDLLREYVELANKEDDQLTPIASIQFEPESFFLLFSNRHQIFLYDWQNDSMLKIISAEPDTVVRFIKFIPGNSNYLLTSTTKAPVKEKLHITAMEAHNDGNARRLLEIFLIIANFVLETTEQQKGGNSRCWSYSIGIQYFMRLFYQVTDLMEKFKNVKVEEMEEEGIDLNFTLNCLRERIKVIKENFESSTTTTMTTKERNCGKKFLKNTDFTDVITELELMLRDFEQETSKKMSLDDLYEKYEKALWKDDTNMPKRPKLHYVQHWNIRKEPNLQQFYSNLVTISGVAKLAVVNDFFVSFNPLLQVIEVISIRKENFGQRTHVLKNFPNFYYFFSVSPTWKNLFIGFKKGLPGCSFETYGIFYELDKEREKQQEEEGRIYYRTVKTDKEWDINCLQFAPNPLTGLIFGYNGPPMYRLRQ